MSIFHFPKYFQLFLIFRFFLVFLKNKNKGEHILFVVFINVSISFFSDFSDFPKSRFFFRVNDLPKNVNDLPKNVNDLPKHVNDLPKKPMPTIHGVFLFSPFFSFFLGILGFFGLFWTFGSNFSFIFFYFIFILFFW
jgi:hypothetical protein